MRIALAVAAAAVACGMTISPELSATNAILDAARTPAVAAFRVSDLTHPITIEPDTSSRIDRTAILRRLFATITKGATGDQAAVIKVAAWVQDYFVHPMHTPLRPNGLGAYDPLQLLRLRRAQCGQVNRVMLDILAAGGYRGRVVQLKNHQAGEVWFGGAWHFIDGNTMSRGEQITDEDGRLPSALEIHLNPWLLDDRWIGGGDEPLLIATMGPQYHAKAALNPSYFADGSAWRDVFSVRPFYYEKSGGTDDPEYGWMTYRTTH